MQKIKPKKWIDINGKWVFQENGFVAQYLGSEGTLPIKYGLSLCDGRLSQGSIKTIIKFSKEVTEGRILFGYNSEQTKYYTAGIGGWKYGYTIQEYIPTSGWKGLKVAGSIQNIMPQKEYQIEVKILGNRIILFIDDIEILEHIIDEPFSGEQIGLFTVGDKEIIFEDFIYNPEEANIFVVMPFSEPYNSFYKEVIRPVSKELNLKSIRVDEVYKPGIILQDIIQGIVEAKIIIAEITQPNQNVFYELGYAHAIGKPTILLAEEGKELPFDIQGYRVIFYQNSIASKKNVEDNLRKHLKAILRRY